jgi:hypothetical protein
METSPDVSIFLCFHRAREKMLQSNIDSLRVKDFPLNASVVASVETLGNADAESKSSIQDRIKSSGKSSESKQNA